MERYGHGKRAPGARRPYGQPPILARLTAAEARREIVARRAVLEEITGRPVTLFAYPNGKSVGDCTVEHVAIVRELGFQGAMSTA